MRLFHPLARLAAVAAVVVAVAAGQAVSPARAETLVFAAASTTNAVEDVIAAYEAESGRKVTPSFASSSTLAKQIAEGAPAQVFISANPKWMSFLEDKGLVIEGSRSDLLGNGLVLIAPKSEAAPVAVDATLPLTDLLGPDGRLSVGDPDHVPAGIYAKQALTALGLWEAVEPRLARASDVRAALALVERGEAPYGIVYATDAAISDGVAVVGTFPEDSHPPITYPAALIAGPAAGTGDEAAAFLAFLKSDTAAAIFKRYGFARKG
jgi:molybdate transport system substrate-binding protein